jgi:hypothetical protein
MKKLIICLVGMFLTVSLTAQNVAINNDNSTADAMAALAVKSTSRIVPEVDKKDDEKGKYLNPEVFGFPAKMGIIPPPAGDKEKK